MKFNVGSSLSKVHWPHHILPPRLSICLCFSLTVDVFITTLVARNCSKLAQCFISPSPVRFVDGYKAGPSKFQRNRRQEGEGPSEGEQRPQRRRRRRQRRFSHQGRSKVDRISETTFVVVVGR